MNYQRNYYEVMGLEQSATQREIKVRYRELARKFHPDLTVDKTFGLRAFMQINKAYRALSDTERRELYDASLNQEQRNVEIDVEVGQIVRDADDAMMRGDTKAARAACENALKSAPKNPEALRVMGDVLAQMGEIDAAVAAYRQSQEVAPSFILASKISRLESRTTRKDLAAKKGGATRIKPAGGIRRWFRWFRGKKTTAA